MLYAYRFFETGQLAFAVPEPSARLIAAIAHYHQARGRVESEQIAEDRRNANQNTEPR